MSEKKSVWQKSRVELFRDLECDERGLSGGDAAIRLERYGPNELVSGEKKSVLRIFLE